MTSPPPLSGFRRGTSLIEVVIAIGVIAVTIPLVFAVMLRTGQSSVSAQAESRCIAIIPACLAEIEAARTSRSGFLPPLPAGEAFPAAGQTLALAFSPDGRPIGTVPTDAYQSGLKEISREPVRFIASFQATPVAPDTQSPQDIVPMRALRITLEYPAAAPAAKRRKLDFHTRIP